MAKSSYYDSNEQLKFIKENLDSQYKYQETAFQNMKQVRRKELEDEHKQTLANITDEVEKEKFLQKELFSWEMTQRAELAAEREKMKEELHEKYLKLLKNLYIVGEVLNVDGDCGGYNLTFAFVSGILSAKNISLIHSPLYSFRVIKNSKKNRRRILQNFTKQV